MRPMVRVQGAVATGIWVIAHECGHGAFSDYSWLNDSVGLVRQAPAGSVQI